MNLVLLPYEQINKQKWDECILRSPNGLIYGCSTYLDAISPNWKGIVLNDYEAVMPLTWRKKWNITYLYQPAFFQQGGIVSNTGVSSQLVNGFLQLASEHFRYAAFTLNYANPITGIDIGKTSLRNNFLA